MDIGVFPWTSVFSMVCFLPGWFWDTALPRMHGLLKGNRFFSNLRGRIFQSISPYWLPLRNKEMAWRDGRYGVVFGSVVPGQAKNPKSKETGSNVDRALPHLQPTRRIAPTRWLALVTNAVAIFSLVFVFAWNMSTISQYTLPQRAYPIGNGLGLYQGWDMFAPQPPRSTTWHAIHGVLQDGREVDMLAPFVHNDLNRIEAFSLQEPSDISNEVYKGEHWRKYLERIGNNENVSARYAFERYVCRTWNNYHGGNTTLVSFQFVVLSRETLPNEENAPVQLPFVEDWNCF